jgi:signal transduction histidine kinase
MLFDGLPFILFDYTKLAILGPLSGLVFSGTLYWACWKKNFFKLRESLNLLSLIILTILISTGFVIPIGREPIVKVIIITLCVGLVVDVWRKDSRLKINYRRARQKVKELQTIQLNSSSYLMDLAHRLKSPLRSIGHLLAGLFTRHKTDQSKLERARSIAVNTNQAMKNLLLAGRIDHQDANLSVIPFNLTNQLNEWIAEWEALCPEHHLTLEMSRDIKEDIQINGDQNALKDALTNLVDNARKHSPTGSQITISLQTSDQMLDISVRDQGRGLPASAQKLIFQKHYQHDLPNQKDVSSSAGLGLHLAKWVAEQHGGTIYVQSRPNKGATFTISLPLLGTIRRARRPLPKGNPLGKRVATKPLRLQ